MELGGGWGGVEEELLGQSRALRKYLENKDIPGNRNEPPRGQSYLATGCSIIVVRKASYMSNDYQLDKDYGTLCQTKTTFNLAIIMSVTGSYHIAMRHHAAPV